MRVLVDTSVWSLAFRKEGPADHPKVEILHRLIEEGEDIALVGVILQELLQGLRSERSFRILSRHLDAFPLLSLDRSDYVAAAELRRKCRKDGIAASTVDCLIAAASVRHDCVLLTNDRDFERIAERSQLRLV